MAPRTQQNLAADERTEREFQQEVNTAVANTEAEIAGFAFGEDEPENDADTSLEQMGEGLEGGDLEDDAEDEELEAAEGDEGEEPEGDEAAEDDAEGDDRTRQTHAEPERREVRGVPPGRHREVAQRARVAETTLEEERTARQTLERELAETRGRLDMLAQTVNSPRQQPQQEQRADPEPDMFVDPEGWKSWNRRQIQAETQQLIRRELGGFQQQLQQRDETRIEQSFQEVKATSAGFMLDAAYRALTSLNPRDARAQATVRRIVASPNPAQATLDWFEDNGAEDYRAQVAEQLGLEPAEGYEDNRSQQRQERRGNGGNQRQGGNRPQPRQQQGQPRQVYRMPVSLNSARGGSGNARGQQQNPDMTDDSDASTFEFAMR